MGMKLIKKTAEYRIYQRRDERYAVESAHGKPVNGDEKVAILLAEGLVTAPAVKQPEPEAAAEEAAADEGAEAAEEAPAEDSAE
ncbi:hypothetical protein [Pseudohaliea rubra]|uniref:Uncharacterized protein n=1 Tax=Pseudohaliea rubra DSM 19751 TaxID=1265313 RepID=A0A095WYF7_9GAMM|nr:hypothetical protein [Pseudohaliea rubra]KGE03649.1 hypothetical protein HRUBRA_01740 [Pseudohaliea rubra DSM 19751]